MLSLALALSFLLAPQDRPLEPSQAPDRSTPEKTVLGFIEWKEGMRARNLSLFKEAVQIEMLGAEHFAGSARDTLDANQKRAGKPLAALASPKIETKVLKQSQAGDKAELEVEVQVARTKDPTQVSKRVMRFQVEKHGDAWLVEKVSRSCWSCGGSGKCRTCAKSGASNRNCYSCKGTAECRLCKGSGIRPDHSHEPNVPLAIPDGDPKFSNDWTSAESGAKSYADLELRRTYERSRLMKMIVDREVALLANWASPAMMKECNDSVAKSVREQAKRYDSARLTLRKLELAGDKATAVFDPDKSSRWPSVKTVELQRFDGEWKVVDVRAENRSTTKVRRSESRKTGGGAKARSSGDNVTVKGVEFELAKVGPMEAPGFFTFEVTARHGGSVSKTCYGRIKLLDEKGKEVGGATVFLKVSGGRGTKKRFHAKHQDGNGHPVAWKTAELEMNVVGDPVAPPPPARTGR